MTQAGSRGPGGALPLALAAALSVACNSVFGIHEGEPRTLCADELLIDDLEDGDGTICNTKGRSGGWFTGGDGTKDAVLAPRPFAPTLIGDGSRGTSRYAAHFSGSGFVKWGAQMGVGFDAKQPYDAATKGGIKFWMRSVTTVWVSLSTLETVPFIDGGQCVDSGSEHNCDNHFSFPIISPSRDWQEYEVPFNALRQLIPGGSAVWNPRHLTAMSFTVPAGAPFDLWVDDLRLYYCFGTECEPTCTAELPTPCRAVDGNPHSSCQRAGTDCAALASCYADPLLIDNMEDGQGALCASDDREGWWFAVPDGRGADPNASRDIELQPTLIPEARGASRFAAHITSSDLNGAGALMGFGLRSAGNGQRDYDARKVDGVSFWMKSSTPVSAEFHLAQTIPLSEFGTCDDSPVDSARCNNHFKFPLAATGETWSEYRIPFSALRQGAGRDANFNWLPGSATWDPTRLRVIAFRLPPSDFDVWVDDIRFFTCGSRDCLSACTADKPIFCPSSSSGQPGVCWPTGTDCSSPPDLVSLGVWGSGPSDVWAVGQSATNGVGIISHWNGSEWARSTSDPTPPIWGVWGSGANDVWAVAEHGTILHKGDSDWGASGRGIGTAGPLTAIWGSSASDIWAVAGAGTVVHWNGFAWSALETGTTERLLGVWGTGSSDVWAVGQNGAIIHWDGDAWSSHPSQTNADLLGAWGSASNDVWAVGDRGVLVHWDGSDWKPMESGTTQSLAAVWGSGPSDVWAVGASGTIVHWDGSRWGAASSNTRRNLRAVWGSQANDVWAVGEDSTILRGDGTSWAPQ